MKHLTYGAFIALQRGMNNVTREREIDRLMLELMIENDQYKHQIHQHRNSKLVVDTISGIVDFNNKRIERLYTIQQGTAQ